jgi:signal transduction histidine kinase
MARFYLLLIFMLCFFTSYAANENMPAEIKLGPEKKYDISAFTSEYIEGSVKVSPGLAFQFFEAGKFRPLGRTNTEYINDGLVNKQSWLALTVDNTRSYESTIVLEFIRAGINSVECYAVDDSQQIQPLFRSKNIKELPDEGLLAKSVIFNLNLQPGEKTLLLIHLVNHGQLLYVPAMIYDLSYFTQLDSNKHNFFGIFQGIFFFIILFNLLLYFTTLDRIYLLYLLYAFFISLFALNEVGSDAYNLAFIPFINHLSGQTFLFLGFSIWLLLMLQFLNLTSKNRMLYRPAILLVVIDLMIAFIPEIGMLLGFGNKVLFQEIYQTTITILFATSLIFIVAANILRLIRGSKLAFFYAAANVPVIIGTIIYYSNYYDFTNIWFGWLNSIALGLSVETFVISFGFAYRFNLISIEKQTLLSDINEQRKEIMRQIIDTQETEQKRIAADLHDELGGNLAAIKMTLQSFKLEEDKSQLLSMLIDKASVNARNIAHNLMPPEFDETNLNDLLNNYFIRLNQEGNIRFNFHYSGANGHFIKQDQLIIYRIILELVHNSLRHANATEITSQLIYHTNQLAIMVEDNGKGFSKSSSDGMGLKNIRSRVNYLNGILNIDSNANGTTIMIQLPYNKEI